MKIPAFSCLCTHQNLWESFLSQEIAVLENTKYYCSFPVRTTEVVQQRIKQPANALFTSFPSLSLTIPLFL